MNITSRLLACALLPIAGVGCGSSGGSSGTGAAATCTNGMIKAAEGNDYVFSSTITLPPVTVKSMANLTIDWSVVNHDFLGHTLAQATDTGLALIMLWKEPLAEFQMNLNADNLLASDLIVSPPPSIERSAGKTSAMLYDFTINGTPVSSSDFNAYFDPSKYSPASNTYLAAIQTGTNLGTGIRMLQAFQLDPASSNTTVTLTNSSTKLQYSTNLHSLQPTGVPASTPRLTLDWGDMKKNALGADFITTNITSAIVGHYTQTPSQLESQFLDLQTIATDLYTADIPSGTVLDFTTLKDGKGSAFPGVDATGTWLVALTCGNCRNPAPWYLTILEPVAQPCK
ncbi:MAG TPA: hypothetical protein VGD55_14050 [Acidothermaceae bacterium]